MKHKEFRAEHESTKTKLVECLQKPHCQPHRLICSEDRTGICIEEISINDSVPGSLLIAT
jgi:hypothetical protein